MSVFDELREHAALEFAAARALPLRAYESEALAARETADLFATDWLCVGRTADVARIGDFITAEIPWTDGSPRSLIILRSDDGEIRVFDNVCVHRGAELLTGCGNEVRITCPYHAWVYRLDGSLVGAPYMADSTEPDGHPFDPSRHHLVGIRAEVWEGFVFVNQDPDAPPLAPSLVGLHDVVCRFAMADYVPVHEQVDVWETNWKLLVENFMDAYHVFKVHRNSFGAMGDSTADTVMFPGTDRWAHHRVVEAGAADMAHPSNEALQGPWRTTTVLAAVFPGFVVQLQPDWLWFLRITPIGTGRVRIAWQVAIAPEMLAGQADPGAYVDEVMALIHLVNSEDRPVVEGLRRGMHRPQFDRAPLSYLERNVYDFDRYISCRLGSN
jgi:phenylpropionate dioxygenase-like ring-hydroxylating dioxygenase large terminal subunit